MQGSTTPWQLDPNRAVTQVAIDNVTYEHNETAPDATIGLLTDTPPPNLHSFTKGRILLESRERTRIFTLLKKKNPVDGVW